MLAAFFWPFSPIFGRKLAIFLKTTYEF
jgi:hypothetical protein